MILILRLARVVPAEMGPGGGGGGGIGGVAAGCRVGESEAWVIKIAAFFEFGYICVFFGGAFVVLWELS